MPITPSSDKTAVWMRIRGDPEILNLMGWTDATPLELAKSIIKRKATDDVLTASKKLICIYNVPSRKTQSVNFADAVLQVDVMVPSADSDKADKVVEKIIKLLTNGFSLNNRPVLFDAQVGDSAAPTGFYCHSVRFNYFCSI